MAQLYFDIELKSGWVYVAKAVELTESSSIIDDECSGKRNLSALDSIHEARMAGCSQPRLGLTEKIAPPCELWQRCMHNCVNYRFTLEPSSAFVCLRHDSAGPRQEYSVALGLLQAAAAHVSVAMHACSFHELLHAALHPGHPKFTMSFCMKGSHLALPMAGACEASSCGIFLQAPVPLKRQPW